MERIVLICVFEIGLGFVFWYAMYPDSYDPKSIAYIGWKAHLLPMEPRRALSIMTHGANSDRLVVGDTRQESTRRFGFVLTADQVSPYLRDYCAATRPSADVFFLNSSDYMVVMSNNQAVELVLCKG